MSTYSGFRYPAEIIARAVYLYHRYALSFREVGELLADRGIEVSYETIRQWCKKFAPSFAKKLKKKRRGYGDEWYLDEVFIKIDGVLCYLWRAVDQDGDELDILVTKRRDRKAAMRFFKKLFKSQPNMPYKIITDKLRSYKAALNDLGCEIEQDTEQYANNKSEVSHQKTRNQQRHMRQFKSMGQAQRFLSCHGVVNNHFRQQRHLMSASSYRILRDRAFSEYSELTCVQNSEKAA